MKDTREVPLCVDLDGTLIRSNLLAETCALLIRHRPLALFWVPFWFFGMWLAGPSRRAEMKRRWSDWTAFLLRPEALPYQMDFLAWLDQQRKLGRPIWLCTGSHRTLAQRVSDHIGLFDGVIATEGKVNLVGLAKAKALIDRFGEKGFDYAGNEAVDLAVWAHARLPVMVNVPPGVARTWTAQGHAVGLSFGGETFSWRSALKAMRPHQWVKNSLVFVPMGLAHRWGNAETLGRSFFAFVVFCLCASAIYLINDLLDLTSDRMHPSKKHRPMASGHLPIAFGAAFSMFLLGSSLVASFFVGGRFFLVILGYVALTSLYSVVLKRLVLVDVVILGLLYTVRLVAGSEATGIALSFWLSLFSLFFFSSLALVKRCAELDHYKKTSTIDESGRGYRIQDLPLLRSLGVACGIGSVLILGLYIETIGRQGLYSHPKAIWGLCVLLMYWIARVWLLTHRGQMAGDPVVFALKDKTSRWVLVFGLLAFWMAL